MTRINFIFVRHGFACHNAVKMFKEYITNKSDVRTGLTDSQLTHYGVESSIWIGCLLKNTLKVISNWDSNYKDIETIDMVGSSPMIRAMETGYYMCENWKIKPEKIYVFPYLRELDERIFENPNLTKYSDPQIYDIPHYAIKSIKKQEEYIDKIIGKNKIDFSYIKKFSLERERPGDIELFIEWFWDKMGKKLLKKNGKKDIYNIIIVTHAGVIREYFKKIVYNNFGFVLPVIIENDEKKIKKDWIIDLEDYFSEDIINNLKFKKANICGIDQTRCNIICEGYNQQIGKDLENIKFEKSCKED